MAIAVRVTEWILVARRIVGRNKRPITMQQSFVDGFLDGERIASVPACHGLAKQCVDHTVVWAAVDPRTRNKLVDDVVLLDGLDRRRQQSFEGFSRTSTSRNINEVWIEHPAGGWRFKQSRVNLIRELTQ